MTGAVYSVLTCRSRSERKACAALEALGVEAWFPSEVVWIKAAGKKKKRKVCRAILAGYVVARFASAPRWDQLLRFSEASLYLTGVMMRRGSPMALSDREIREFRIMEINGRNASAQAWGKNILRIGDRVQICAGAFAGFVAQVKEITGKRARLEVDLLGKPTPLELGIEELAKFFG